MFLCVALVNLNYTISANTCHQCNAVELGEYAWKKCSADRYRSYSGHNFQKRQSRQISKTVCLTRLNNDHSLLTETPVTVYCSFFQIAWRSAIDRFNKYPVCRLSSARRTMPLLRRRSFMSITIVCTDKN